MSSTSEGPTSVGIYRRAAWSNWMTVAGALVLTLSLVSCGGRADPGTSAAEQLAFGVEMAKRGLWGEALFRFQQAQRLSPTEPRILNNLAVAYEATGQFDQALATYRAAIQVASGNEALRQNYSRFSEFYATHRAPEETESEAEGVEKKEEKKEMEKQQAADPVGTVAAPAADTGEGQQRPPKATPPVPSAESPKESQGRGEPTSEDPPGGTR